MPTDSELRLVALLQEYESLSTEKQIHKQAIRNIHVYLASLISAGVTLLAFLGLPVDTNSTPDTLWIVGNLLLAALVPSSLIVCAFGINDFYQVYVMSRQLSHIETKVNRLLKRSGADGQQLAMSWEGTVCPVVFGGKAISWYTASGKKKKAKLLRPAVAGDILAVLYLVPLIIIATQRSFVWLLNTVGWFFAIAYLLFVVLSMLVVVAYGAYAVRVSYFDGPLQAVFKTLESTSPQPEEPAAESKKDRRAGKKGGKR